MKPLKKVTDLKEHEVIHCKTEKEAKAICQLMHDAGLKWCSDKSYLDYNRYDVYESNIVYYPNTGTYGDLRFAEKNGRIIHPAKDFLTQKVTKKEILNRIEKLEEDFKKFDAIAKATTMVHGTLKAIQIIKESENSPLPNMEKGCNVVISGKEKLLPKEFEKEAEKIFSNQIPNKHYYESFIGKKMKGFKFSNTEYVEIGYNELMEKHIGEVGEIHSYHTINNKFYVEFENKSWHYPADLAIQHIVEDTTTNLQVPVTDNEKEKVLLYLDMLEHARSVNGDWVPDWENEENKYILQTEHACRVCIDLWRHYNKSVFGIAYKTKELAEQAKEKFSERILKYYGN